MTNNLEDFEERLKKARGEDAESLAKKEKEESDQTSRDGVQAGVELVGAIILPSLCGYWLDNWLGTTPAFMISLFFLGVSTGFYNVYRITQNLGTAVGNKSETSPLSKDTKPARKSASKIKNDSKS